MMAANTRLCIACDEKNEIFIDRIWDDRYGSPGVFSVLKCRNCGQMVTSPPLAESDLPRLYSQYYPRGSVDFDAIETEAAAVLAPGAAQKRHREGTDNQGHYFVKPGQSVLDIGCGSCVSLLEVRNLGGISFGIETDPNVRAIADHFNLNVHIGSIHDHPFPSQSFDLIVLNQVIEHVPDPLALLRIVRERLAPGGKVVLAFPNNRSLNRVVSRRRWINWHIPYHLHFYNKQSFDLIARKAGYRVESTRTITPNLWTILQIRMFGNSPKEGEPSSAWVGPAKHAGNQSRLLKWKARLASRLIERAGKLAVSLNRTIDSAGFGDSLLVVLQRLD